MAVDPRTAGMLRERVLFQQRALDANGVRLGPWVTTWSARARIVYLHGGENIMAERLQGGQPAIITVRYCDAAKAIENGWRAIDAHKPSRVWDIKSTEPDERHAWIDIMVSDYVGQLQEA
jgi:head-tail adaptor